MARDLVVLGLLLSSKITNCADLANIQIYFLFLDVKKYEF